MAVSNDNAWERRPAASSSLPRPDSLSWERRPAATSSSNGKSEKLAAGRRSHVQACLGGDS